MGVWEKGDFTLQRWSENFGSREAKYKRYNLVKKI